MSFLRFLSVLFVTCSVAGGTSSTSANTEQIPGGTSATLTANSELIVFSSGAADLVPGDTNDSYDVFVYNRLTGAVTRVSVDSSENQANYSNSGSQHGSISASGNYMAFSSLASNLVSGDNNSKHDIFVRDLGAGSTERISLDPSGSDGNNHSFSPALDQSGTLAAFASLASNLVVGDSNSAYDIFVRDLLLQVTRRVSVDAVGNEANGQSGAPSISSSGRFVAFQSTATNLVADDTNNADDVFVFDLQTAQVQRVSLQSSGGQGNDRSGEPSISADGRFVAFSSRASNLVPGDTNGTLDIFVRDRQLNLTERVNLDSTGDQTDIGAFLIESMDPSIGADGRFVVFSSDASDLVPSDTNNTSDIFIRDRVGLTTERISVTTEGNQFHTHMYRPSISGDGQFIVFDDGRLFLSTNPLAPQPPPGPNPVGGTVGLIFDSQGEPQSPDPSSVSQVGVLGCGFAIGLGCALLAARRRRCAPGLRGLHQRN